MVPSICVIYDAKGRWISTEPTVYPKQDYAALVSKPISRSDQRSELASAMRKWCPGFNRKQPLPQVEVTVATEELGVRDRFRTGYVKLFRYRILSMLTHRHRNRVTATIDQVKLRVIYDQSNSRENLSG